MTQMGPTSVDTMQRGCYPLCVPSPVWTVRIQNMYCNFHIWNMKLPCFVGRRSETPPPPHTYTQSTDVTFFFPYHCILCYSLMFIVWWYVVFLHTWFPKIFFIVLGRTLLFLWKYLILAVLSYDTFFHMNQMNHSLSLPNDQCHSWIQNSLNFSPFSVSYKFYLLFLDRLNIQLS